MKIIFLRYVPLIVAFTVVSGCKLPSGSGAASVASPAPSPTVSSLPTSQPTKNCISDVNPRFSHIMVDPAYVRSVSPLPALAGSVAFEGRSYVAIDAQYDGVPIPVYAPTRMTLKAAKHYIPTGAPQNYHPDWALAFEVSCEVDVGFAHIKEVSPKIEAVNNAPLDGNSGPVQTLATVEFEAGEILGYYIKASSSIAFDFIVTNSSVVNQFANQERYLSENNKLLHVVCPWDLFEGGVKSAYYALIGNVGTTPDPLHPLGCGTLQHDVVGTPSGAWFPDAATSSGARNSDFSVFLAEDGWVYVGHEGFQMLRIAPGNSTHADPALITGEHCFQDQSGYAYIRMVSSDELQVARANSRGCPGSFPLSGYLTMYR